MYIQCACARAGLVPKSLKQFLAHRFEKDSADHRLQQTIRANVLLRTIPCACASRPIPCPFPSNAIPTLSSVPSLQSTPICTPVFLFSLLICCSTATLQSTMVHTHTSH